MEGKQQKHIIDLLFVVALFCLFALSAIFLISIGADIYGKTVNTMEQNFNTRTSIAYITEKVRQSDQENTISLGTLANTPAIIISSNVADVNYETYLYEYDGSLRELILREDVMLGPEAGQEILSVYDFSLTPVNDKLFNCTITADDQQTYELYISVHSGGLTNEK